jgi:hypothetical protein
MKTPKSQNAHAKSIQSQRPFFSKNNTPFFTKNIQPQLNIDHPNSLYEQEADRMAEKVVQGNHTPLIHQITPASQGNMALSRSNTTSKSTNTSPSFPTTLSNRLGKGHHLDSDTKTEMESSFGADFSNVRIHTDGTADSLTTTLGARAFATGQDIFFQSGNYSPETKQGKRLLAHELTHTIQQKNMSAGHIQGFFIQGEKIRYRQINWSDFEGGAPEGSTHDAAVDSGVEPVFDGQMVNVNWTHIEDDEYELSVTYNRDAVSVQPYMDTEQSWKAAWLTDDDAARAKLGEDADIDAARSRLLSHEQVHFQNAQTAAERYEQRAKEQLPEEPYTERVTASSREELVQQATALMERKAEEANANIQTVIDEAVAELGQVQSVYDTDTDHSQTVDVQQEWYDNYDEKYREARELDMNQEQETDEEHTHDEH